MFCLAWAGYFAESSWLGISGFYPLYSPWNSSSRGPMRGWNHLTYGDGIKGRVAIFRTLGFRAPSLGSVGVPGLKVREQLSRELGGH